MSSTSVLFSIQTERRWLSLSLKNLEMLLIICSMIIAFFRKTKSTSIWSLNTCQRPSIVPAATMQNSNNQCQCSKLNCICINSFVPLLIFILLAFAIETSSLRIFSLILQQVSSSFAISAQPRSLLLASPMLVISAHDTIVLQNLSLEPPITRPILVTSH